MILEEKIKLKELLKKHGFPENKIYLDLLREQAKEIFKDIEKKQRDGEKYNKGDDLLVYPDIWEKLKEKYLKHKTGEEE